jgi:hypothetical protein
LVLNSPPLPCIVSSLLSLVDQRLGSGTSERFLANLSLTGHGDELSKPMLMGAGAWSLVSIDEIAYSSVSGVRVENPEPHPNEIIFSVEFPAGTVEDVFSRFIRATAHSNPLGDFRAYPERYSPILAGPRYFVFHGDGHCFALSNLLAQTIQRLTGADVGVRYMVTKDRSFIHTVVEWQETHGRRKILDADQKTCADWDSEGLPRGMIYQLLGFAGSIVFDAACADGRSWVFAEDTRNCFSDFYNNASMPPRIYQSSPTPELISGLFERAKAEHIESVSFDVDDYAWKRGFRSASEGRALLSHLDQPLRMTLPAGACLAIGLDVEPLPAEAALLPLVFFGRVPATVRAAIPASGRLELLVPERPWLLCLPRSVAQVSINGCLLDARPSSEFSVIGGTVLDDVIGEPGIVGCTPAIIEGPPGTVVRIVMPFNALAFNSGVIRMSGPSPVSVARPRFV